MLSYRYGRIFPVGKTITNKRATRLVALEWARYFAVTLRAHEQGGNNRGPLVDAIENADTLPGKGYAWCQSFQNACWRLATGGRLVKKNGVYTIVGGNYLMGGTASVGLACEKARQLGYVVKRPYRGDHFGLQLGSDSWPDHTGIVDRVLSLGPLGFLCRTIEGNTSNASIQEGDACAVKTRFLSKRTIFYRVPGLTLNPHLPPKG